MKTRKCSKYKDTENNLKTINKKPEVSKSKKTVVKVVSEKSHEERAIKKQKHKRKCYASAALQETIQKAIESINEGASLREAGKMQGIPYSTLFKKMKYPEVIARKVGPSTVLTLAEEKNIVTWLIYRGETGSPVTKSELLDSIEKYIVKEQKDNCFKKNRPGKKWFVNFRKRNPEVSIRVAQNLPLARAAITQDDLRLWFKEITVYLEKKKLIDLHPSRIYNCDETNIQLHPKIDKVLVEKGARSVYKVVDAPERESVTALFMYNTEGVRAPPMILYTFKELPKKVVQNIPLTWSVGLSDSGWMNTETFYEYMTRVFYPWLIKSGIELPVIVYMDGHASHVTLPLVNFCIEKGIELITLLAHSTHIMQPLDISFFHPLKEVYRKKAVPQWKQENNDRRMRKEDFPKVLELALDLFSGEKDVIINGFRAAGLYPFDPENIDYNVLKKSKKSKKSIVNSQVSNENKCHSNFEDRQTHLKNFEKNLPPSLLNQFKIFEESQEWLGSIENKGLFMYWLSLKKYISGTLFDDNQNIVININSSRHLPRIKNIELVNIELPLEYNKHSASHESKQVNIDKSVKRSFEESNVFEHPVYISEEPTLEESTALDDLLHVSNELLQLSQHELLEVITLPQIQESKIVAEKVVLDDQVEPTSDLEKLSDKKKVPLSDLSNHIIAITHTNTMNLDSAFDQENQGNHTIIKQTDSFHESFTLPVDYLPKTKKAKVLNNGKKKLPAVGTSEDWLKIQVEKERQQKIKEDKLHKKKELQLQKKILSEEKKKLQEQMKLLPKKNKSRN